MESNNNESIFAKEVNPFLQAGIALCGAIAFMILGYLVEVVGIMEMGMKFPWTSAGAFILMFAVFNSVNSFSTKNMMYYYRNSIFGYMVLVFGASFMAYLFSGTSINDAGTYRWIFLMLTFSYFAFVAIVLFIKGIFRLLQTEEEKLSKRIDEE